MTLFYLSFAEPRPPKGRGWLGGVYIEGDDLPDAVMQAWNLGLNPGGSVLGTKVPPHVEVGTRWRYRLLSKDEVRESDSSKRLVNQRGKEV